MSFPPPLQIELPHGARRLLEVIAEHGPFGDTVEEVAAFLIIREIDDLMRCEAIRIAFVEASKGDQS